MPQVILVADDDPGIREMIVDVLKDEGFAVEVSVGAATLAELRKHRPDVVLLDYQMPEMDGVAIARRIRSDPEFAQLPIIAMTAAGRAAWVCQQMHADGCLGKPFDIADLIDVLDQPVHQAHSPNA